MCIRLILQAAVSFRAASKAIHIAFSNFPAIKNQAIPGDKSVRRWLTRIGLYKLNCLKEQGTDWALIIDNSIQLGVHKCLVILGLRLSKLPKRALTFEDMDVLAIEIHENTDAKSICESLKKAQKRVGQVRMVCADDGPDLRRGLNMFCKEYNIGRVLDVTHKIGTFLKKFLEKDAPWGAFTAAAAEAKRKMQQTPAAHLAPPNQRTKSRFLNIEILACWGSNVAIALKNPKHPDKELLEKYCGWVRRYETLIEQLSQMVLISQKVRQHIREHGLSKNTGDQIEKILEDVIDPLAVNMLACEYAGKLIDFCHEQSAVVPTGQVWVGSSEIIESLFGKLKNLEQDQSKSGFTSLVLGAAACVGKIDADTIHAAMREVKTADVDSWAAEQIGPTLLSRRKKAFGSRHRKKKRKKFTRELAGVSLEKAA